MKRKKSSVTKGTNATYLIFQERKIFICVKETSVYLLYFENLLHSVIHQENAPEFQRSLIINIRKSYSASGIGNISDSYRVQAIHNGKISK